MLNSSKNFLSKKVKTDIFLIFVFNLIFYFIFSDIDALEWLYAYSVQHEDYELDEIIVLFITLTISFAIFSLRRLNESKLLINEITEMATKDPLTNLYNRRYFNEELESEVKRAQRTSVFFSLIMLDLDFFKKINDHYGHNVGDKVLCQISEVFVGNCRETDIVARWGGEEFIVFCPHTNIDGAIELGNKILHAVNDYNFYVVEHITVSVGVTEFTKNDSSESVIKRVDSCLYDAKDKGRNSLVSSVTPPNI